MFEFSVASLIWGLIVTALGAALVYFHKPLADHLGSGAGSYEKYKLYGVIAVIFGILLLFNIPQSLLYLIVTTLFGAGS